MKTCPHCGEKEVSEVNGVEPFSTRHLQCGSCDSTFTEQSYHAATKPS